MLDKKIINLTISKAKNTSLDVPIGAVIVKNGEIISLQTNKREQDKRTIAHAEILAIDEANKKLNSWRLDDCEMFVTLEPCPMCAWAIINSRIKTLYFGSCDTTYGGFSTLKLNKIANSKLNIIGGVEEEECNRILEDYFKNLRGKNEK